VNAGTADRHPPDRGDPEGEPARDDPGRNETEAERADRNLVELIQEIRVGMLGIQVLFGFQLTIPFDSRFRDLDPAQIDVYLASIMLSALATVLLSGPVAYHRLLFRRHDKPRLLAVANVMAVAGLAAVALAVSTAVLLVTSFVVHGATGPVLAGCTAAAFAALWFVFPVTRRWQRRAE
jgi:O-antigen/teichoic acid export membrane protein